MIPSSGVAILCLLNERHCWFVVLHCVYVPTFSMSLALPEPERNGIFISRNKQFKHLQSSQYSLLFSKKPDRDLYIWYTEKYSDNITWTKQSQLINQPLRDCESPLAAPFILLFSSSNSPKRDLWSSSGFWTNPSANLETSLGKLI